MKTQSTVNKYLNSPNLNGSKIIIIRYDTKTCGQNAYNFFIQYNLIKC